MRLLITLLLLSLPLHATATESPLVLAFYAPTAPLPSAEARFGYVDKLARQLVAAGIPAQGRAFARAADLEGAIKHGQIDLAILDAVYLAERGVNYPVLAVATASGETSSRWGLYTSLPQGNVLSLSGKRLAWALVGNRDPLFLDNVLLDGELKVAPFFDLRPPAPDVAAAVSDVVLQRADCVFAPEQAAAGKNLRKVYDAGKVLNPALVLVQPRLSREVVGRIQRTIIASASLGGLDGWRTSAAEPYKQLRQRLLTRNASKRLIMVEPQPLLTEINSSMLVRGEPAPSLPPLRGLFQAPTGVP